MFQVRSLHRSLLAVAFAASSAFGLGVGDTVPYLVVDGLDGEGNPTILSLRSVDKPEQSYTMIGFSAVEDQVSMKNLATLVAQSIDLAPDVATRLVAVDSEVELVKDFRESYKGDLKFPVVFDPQQNALRAYGLTKVPALFMVNFDGKILAKVEGELSTDKVNVLRKAVGYEPVAGAAPLKVGDTMPAVALSVRFPDGRTVVKDIRKADLASQRHTIIGINSIYSKESSQNLSAYKTIAEHSTARAALRYVAIDRDSQAVLSYVRKYPAYFNYSVALDPTQQVPQRLNEAKVPTTYVVDASGKIVYRKTGVLLSADINAIWKILFQ